MSAVTSTKDLAPMYAAEIEERRRTVCRFRTVRADKYVCLVHGRECDGVCEECPTHGADGE